MTLPPEVAAIYVIRADESLSRHRRSPEDTCDWCAAVWGKVVRYPCFPAQVAVAIREVCQRP